MKLQNVIIALAFIILPEILFAEGPPAAISGTVSSKESNIPFATIVVKGTTIGTTSNEDGFFQLPITVDGSYVLKIQALGYRSEERPVVIKAGQTLKLNISLNEDYINLEQVVVTGNRNEERRRDAAMVVSYISPKVFENANAVCMAEGLNFQPGLRLETNCQNCGFQQVRINGMEGPYSQILIDSRPIFSSLTAVYGLEQIPVSMIDRVEVLRGGGSAIYGSNAIAGTINIITKEPISNSFTVAANSGYIKGGSPDNAINLNTSIVAPSNSYGMMLYGAFRNRDSYDNNNDGFTEIGKIENSTLGFRNFFRLTKQTKLTATYHNIHEFRRGGNLLSLQPHETDITEQTEHLINGGGISVDYTSIDTKLRLSAYSSAQKTDRKSYYGAGKDLNAYGKTNDISWVNGGQMTNSIDNLIFAPATVTSGIEYQYNFLRDQMEGYNRDLKQTVNIGGAFLQNEWKMEKLTILVGARADKHNHMDEIVVSPRVNLLYKPTSDLQLRTSYSTGFRAPQAFDEDLHIMAAGGEVILIEIDEDLKPERSQSYSASAEWFHAHNDHQWSVLTEGFYTELNDVFILNEHGVDSQGNKLLLRTNGSGAKVFGVNLEVKFAPSSKWMLTTGFTLQKNRYNNAEQWSIDPAVATTRKMSRTPEQYGFITTNVTVYKGLKLSLSGTYTGTMQVPHYAGYSAQDKMETSPIFYEANVKVSYDFKLKTGLDIQINSGVQNVFNAYQSDFDIGPNRDSGYVYGPSKPRTVFIGLKFGNLF